MVSIGIEIIPIQGMPLVEKENDIPRLILDAIQVNGLELVANDIIVVAHTLVSKAEGRVLDGTKVKASKRAIRIAKENGFDPVQVEIAIQESKSILRENRALITQLSNGHICNFSGVDRSNAPLGSYICLPIDPDESAKRIQSALEKATGVTLAVIISDTEGRPWRKGAVNLAIGCAGINAFKYNQGKPDLYGRILQHSLVCQIDEIAAAAELVMGQANEGIPVVIVRGYEYEKGTEPANAVHRPMNENLFK
ncbi:MAG: coenzyme F420-0:L-glutamate ligase [Candidatus Thorarchaeota archaeon]